MSRPQPPADIQIDIAIQKLGLGSRCLPRIINAKVDRWLKSITEAPKRG